MPPARWMSPWSKARCLTNRDAERLRAIRKRAKTLVALGTCAVWGGVAAMDRGADRRETPRGSLRRDGTGVRFRARPGAARDRQGGSQHHRLPHREGAFSGGHRQPAEWRRPALSRVSRLHRVPHAREQLPADRARRALLRPHHRGRLPGALSRTCGFPASAAAVRWRTPIRPPCWRCSRRRASTGSASPPGCGLSRPKELPNEHHRHRTPGPRRRPRRHHRRTGRRHGRAACASTSSKAPACWSRWSAANATTKWRPSFPASAPSVPRPIP